jgi:hypothetical protein
MRWRFPDYASSNNDITTCSYDRVKIKSTIMARTKQISCTKRDTDSSKKAPLNMSKFRGKRIQSEAAIDELQPEAKRQTKNSSRDTVMIYAVMRHRERTVRGFHYQDNDYSSTEPIELYSTLEHANNRVRAEWEEWTGKVSQYEFCEFDFTSDGDHFWRIVSTPDVEGEHLYINERPVKASKHSREWKRKLPDEEESEEESKRRKSTLTRA